MIFKERAGVISKGPCWVCLHGYYMYAHDSLIGLLWQIVTEWKHDRHIVG